MGLFDLIVNTIGLAVDIVEAPIKIIDKEIIQPVTKELNDIIDEVRDDLK